MQTSFRFNINILSEDMVCGCISARSKEEGDVA
jgi:hypothetical protein